MPFTLPLKLYESYKRATNLLSAYPGIVRVYSHYDADGIASAGILARTLQRFGKEFQITCRKNLDAEFSETLKKEKNKLLIIADMGTNIAPQIKEHVEYLIILDHHEPSKEIIEMFANNENIELKNIILLNSHIFGINGTKEACAATMCFLFSIFCDPVNWDLLPFAIAGCEGDKQNSDGKFYGLNSQIIEEGVSKGIVEKRKTFAFDGETVYNALSETNDPFFMDFVLNPDKLEQLLVKLEIDRNTKILELSPEKFKKLVSILALQYIKNNVDINAILTLCQYDYFTKEGVRGKTLANYLNACGRKGRFEVGIGLFFDFAKYVKEAEVVRNAYRARVREYLVRVLKEGTKKMEAIQYTWIEEAEYGGAVGGLALTYFLDKTMPVFVLSHRKAQVSISSRGIDALVRDGLNLGEACRIAAEKCGGTGGGHNIAAGAEVPAGKEEDFLCHADEIVKKQMGR
ncbi:MAG: DHHA1 domain-containing protein [Thermoplasmata archaeon]